MIMSWCGLIYVCMCACMTINDVNVNSYHMLRTLDNGR